MLNKCKKQTIEPKRIYNYNKFLTTLDNTTNSNKNVNIADDFLSALIVNIFLLHFLIIDSNHL